MKLWQQILIVILATATIGTWSLVLDSTKDGLLHVYALDVGQGDAIFIQSQAGTQILIDGGPGNKILSSLNKVMPRADNTIDMVILTHPDYDHIAGLLPVLEKYEVGIIAESGGVSDSDIYQEFIKLRDEEVDEVTLLKSGDRIVLDEETRLDVILPEKGVVHKKSNEGVIVAKLLYGDVSLLLTGDAERSTEARLLQSEFPLASTVLKVPHHGSRFSSTNALLAAVRPKFSLVSVGKNNYGHPSPEALERIEDVESLIYRTDQEGTIHLVSDGSHFLLENE